FPPRTGFTMSTEQVKAFRPDFVIATAPTTRSKMRSLAMDIGAVYVDQVGNAWDDPIGDVILRSVSGDKGILYHPEFHRIPYQEPTRRRVGSFHSWLATSPCREQWDRAV